MFRTLLTLAFVGLFATSVLALEPVKHQGKVVGVGDGTIMIVDMLDGETETFKVASDCMVVVDGKKSLLNSIQIGFTAEIVSERGKDTLIAKTIRASSKLSPKWVK